MKVLIWKNNKKEGSQGDQDVEEEEMEVLEDLVKKAKNRDGGQYSQTCVKDRFVSKYKHNRKHPLRT